MQVSLEIAEPFYSGRQSFQPLPQEFGRLANGNGFNAKTAETSAEDEEKITP